MGYTYIDGDNIGLIIEKSFLENDERSLISINNEVKDSISLISKFLSEQNQEIIFSGADGIICKGENLNIGDTIDFIRLNNKSLTFSIGEGINLKDCYMALRYAKSINKNIGVSYRNNKFDEIDGKKTKKTLNNTRFSQ
jgi:hypothetical protein